MRLIDADAFERRCMFDSNIEDMQDVIYALRDFSTFEPSRPTGKWIENDSFTCSECGYRMVVGDGAYNYCPNCGSYNGGEDD